MIKKVELYKGKYIDLDVNKVKDYIFNLFCILLVSFFIIIQEYQFFPNTLTVKTAYVINISFIFAFVYICVKIFERQYKFNVYDLLILIYMIFITFSSIFSEYKDNVVLATAARCEGLLALIAYLITFYIFKEAFKYNEKIFNILTISLLLVCCFGIVQALIGRFYGFAFNQLGEQGKYMTFGTMPNPNMFSSFLTLFLPIYIVKYLYNKEKIYLVISTIIFAALICTKTFGGYLAFFIYFTVLSLYFIITSKQKKTVLLKVFSLVVVFLVTFFILNVVNDNVYMSEFVENTNSSDDSEIESQDTEFKFANNRGYIWNMTLNIIKEHPILGVGPDSLKHEVYYKYSNRDDYIFGEAIVDKAHSEYLHIAATTGVPSLIVYIVLIMVISFRLLFKFINIVKTRGASSKEAIFVVAITASIFAYLFQAAANISVTSVAPFFWAMLGIGANISQKETQSS